MHSSGEDETRAEYSISNINDISISCAFHVHILTANSNCFELSRPRCKCVMSHYLLISGLCGGV